MTGRQYPYWARLRCMIFSHRLTLVQAFTPSQRRVRCTRCKRHFAMHDGHQAFLPWDSEFTELYEGFGYEVV